MQDFVYGEDFCPFIEEPTGSEIRRYHPGNLFSFSCVAIAVENLTRRRRRKNCDASTYQSNNFGVSRKRFKPSTPGSTTVLRLTSVVVGLSVQNVMWLNGNHCVTFDVEYLGNR